MGGFRVRKSIRVAPGVRLNVSKTGVGISAGVGGVRHSVHSSGRQTTTVRTGVPGVYYQSSHRGTRQPSAPREAGYGPLGPRPRKPGLFAPKAAKELFKALKEHKADLVERVGQEHAQVKLPALTLAGLMFASVDGDKAVTLLEQAFEAGDAAQTEFFKKYVQGEIQLKIAEWVTAYAPLGREAVGLTLAELYQTDDKFEQAIDVVEQLEPTTYTAVSLAELYAQEGRFQDVIELTEGVSNEDDASALLLVFRGVAFREQGFNDAAHESFKEALRARSRAATIRHYALFERARNYETQGKKAMAPETWSGFSPKTPTTLAYASNSKRSISNTATQISTAARLGSDPPGSGSRRAARVEREGRGRRRAYVRARGENRRFGPSGRPIPMGSRRSPPFRGGGVSGPSPRARACVCARGLITDLPFPPAPGSRVSPTPSGGGPGVVVRRPR
jgi:tetratricopeptide (TPR) repeat protein